MVDLKRILSTIVQTASKHSPEILTGLGIVGFGTTIVMTAKASPTIKDIHGNHENERRFIQEHADDVDQMKEDIKESYLSEAKALAPLVLPTAGVGVVSVACFVCANKIHADRRAAVMAAYSLSEKTLSAYQEKVIEKLGEETHRDILDEASKEVAHANVDDTYQHELEVIPAGKTRFFDTVTGRYFYSTKEKVYEAESIVNQMLIDQTIVKHQEFYYALDLEQQYYLGDAMGWDISAPGGCSSLKVWLSPHLDDDKNPCVALNYHVVVFDRMV